MKVRALCLLFLVTALLAVSNSAVAAPEKIKFKTGSADAIPTNVLGTSITKPPDVNVIRSSRGANYFISKFVSNNLSSDNRLHALRKELRAINYDQKMAIVVVSPPMDNYQINIRSVELENDVVTVNVNYKHEMKDYAIPPKKAYFYYVIVVDKMPQPVVLNAKLTSPQSNVKKNTPITVTGRLMPWKEKAFQLVPLKIRRGQKNSYYIRGAQTENLKDYLGKEVTLSGTISHDVDSPYEADMTVEKVVKVAD